LAELPRRAEASGAFRRGDRGLGPGRDHRFRRVQGGVCVEQGRGAGRLRDRGRLAGQGHRRRLRGDRALPDRAHDWHRAALWRLGARGRQRGRPPHGPLGPACARGGSRAGASARHRACRRARARFRARRTRGGTVILLTFVAATPSPTPTASPGAGIFSSPILLSLLIWVPVLMAIAIASMPNPRGRYDTLMKQIAFFTTLGLVFILFVAYNQFENFLPTMQYEERLDWLPAIGVKYHLGIDGPGLVMLVLSGLIGVASVLASLGVRERVRAYFCLLLLAEASVNGAIVSRVMFVLILFWGASTIPLALLILGWGGPRRS